MRTEALSSTRTGVLFDLLNPKVEEVFLEDIAYALAGIFRFNGHTRYSVAQHSVDVAIKTYVVAPYNSHRLRGLQALKGLMHDAHEAYTGDLTRPVQAALKHVSPRGLKSFIEIQEGIQRAIERRFALEGTVVAMDERIKSADVEMGQLELKREFDPAESIAWTPQQAEVEFLWAFRYFDGLRMGTADPTEWPHQVPLDSEAALSEGIRALAGVGDTQPLPNADGD